MLSHREGDRYNGRGALTDLVQGPIPELRRTLSLSEAFIHVLIGGVMH